jgi:molybdopterin-guanine dinucleotide biosynthesis protein MobB
VIKNVKGHPVDEKGKDSYRFTEAGALYSVIQNSDKEMAIFMKCKEDRFEELLKWLNASPIKSDIMFTEGFRNLNNPTVLCISEIDEIGDQLTENVKMISGVICSKTRPKNEINNIPIVDIKVQFQEFLKLFNIFPKRS